MDTKSDRTTIKSSDIYNSFFGHKKETAVPSLSSLQHKYKVTGEATLPSKELALRRAAHQGNSNDIEFLINNYGADVTSKSKNGFSALDWAYVNDHMASVNALCWLGADQSILKPLLAKYVLDTESEWPTKNIALSRAAVKGRDEDVLVLVRTYKADIHSKINGSTPIELASLNHHLNTVSVIEEIIQQTDTVALGM